MKYEHGVKKLDIKVHRNLYQCPVCKRDLTKECFSDRVMRECYLCKYERLKKLLRVACSCKDKVSVKRIREIMVEV